MQKVVTTGAGVSLTAQSCTSTCPVATANAGSGTTTTTCCQTENCNSSSRIDLNKLLALVVILFGLGFKIF